jgi:hypothetical protein
MIYRIGIDCGVNTGIAIVQNGYYVSIETMTITKAIKIIDTILLDGQKVELYVEDPNLRKWYGTNANLKKQGAGSVKRDYSIWKTYCKENNIKLHPVHPKDVGSLFDNEVLFKSATKWLKKCSIHARDAARMVYKFVK